MDTDRATDLLSALAHPRRLDIFRLLTKHAPDGVNAGALAKALKIAPSALSFHLNQLEQSGLIGARRTGRNIVYSMQTPRMRALLEFLTEDCCGGRPELCAGLARSATLSCR